MKLRRRSQEVPGLNTTSTADISFMLLVFFLVTTSMYVDKGLNRQMPPKEDETKDAVNLTVNQDKIIQFSLDASGKMHIGDSISSVEDAKSKIVELIRRCPTDHIISVSASAQCPYDAYFQLQNAISESYKTVRDELSKRKYGRTLDKLADSDRDAILKQCPQRVAEDYDMSEGGQQ